MTCIELIKDIERDHSSQANICNSFYPASSFLVLAFDTVLFWLVIASVTATRWTGFILSSCLSFHSEFGLQLHSLGMFRYTHICFLDTGNYSLRHRQTKPKTAGDSGDFVKRPAATQAKGNIAVADTLGILV